MALDPRTRDEIYDSLKNGLQGKISGLTNFVENTFNYVWAQAFSQELHKQEVAASAVQLSGWADYVGKNVTDEDLDDLDIDGAKAIEMNDFMAAQHLDEFAKAFGVSRDQGARATGNLEITTNSSTSIPEGTEFGTQPDSTGEYYSFFTQEDATTTGATTVTVEIQAEEVGNEYNVGSGKVTYMPNPPSGVDSVTNPNATNGGKNAQTNAELRSDMKNAVIESTEGGTTDGVTGYIEQNTEASDVIVDEKFNGDSEHGSYPHAHAIVLGGTDSNITDSIAKSHPSGVEHFLERPDTYSINIDADVDGSDIDKTEIESDLSGYFDGLLLGGSVIRDKIIQTIMNADADVLNIITLAVEVDSETHTIDGELVDDFEDNDITVADADWTGWSGATTALTAQGTTVLSGTYSAELAAANASNTVTASRSATVSNAAQWQVQLDNQTTNSGDGARFEFLSGTTSLGYLEFDGAGNVDWYNGASTNITTWAAGTTYEPLLDFDFANDQVTITVDGTSATVALQNAVSGYDEISITNDTTVSTGTVNTYFDQVKQYELVYSLGKGGLMEADGITVVSDDTTTFTEATDFEEEDTDGDGMPDAVRWLAGGSEPSIGSNFYVTYLIEDDITINNTEVATLNAATITVV